MTDVTDVTVSDWVSALRSGEYEQGLGVLRDGNDRFCCMGVLCDLIDHDSWVDDSFPVDDYILGSFRFEGRGHVAPDWVPETVGLSGLQVSILMALNDGNWKLLRENGSIVEYLEKLDIEIVPNDTGYTFRQIAGVIDRMVEVPHE